MAQTFERKVISDGSPTLPQVPLWPRPAAYSVPADAQVLPVPGAHIFKYSRVFRLGPPDKPKVAVKRPARKREAGRGSAVQWPVRAPRQPPGRLPTVTN